MARGIYKVHVDCGRHGDLDGKFTAEPEDISFTVGHRLHFDEPWGKHSSVDVTIGEDAFVLVSDDPAEVATFIKLDLVDGECPLGLLHDSISYGAIELTPEQEASAPPYFQEAISQNIERLRAIEKYKQRRG